VIEGPQVAGCENWERLFRALLNRASLEREGMSKQEQPATTSPETASAGRSWTIAYTSFLFILLQSACTAFMAISGLRLLIGIGSLAAATAGLRFLDALHRAEIRIPMEIVAIAGSAINLYQVWRIRSLRARPASQWRMVPPTRKQERSESIQVVLAVVTLLLVAVEWSLHIYLHGSI
jgi:hypothetical protein